MTSMTPYCEKGVCTNNCFASKALKRYCIQQLQIGHKCKNDFNMIKGKSVGEYNSLISVVNFNQMLVNVQIQYRYWVKDVIGVLDTGAQANLISLHELKKLFVKFRRTDIQTNEEALEGPTNKKIEFIGTINLLVTIGKKSEEVLFFVVPNECQMLIGMPTLSKFQVVIDLQKQQVYFVDKVNAIHWTPKRKMKVINKTKVLKLRPRKHYEIRCFKPIMLELVVCGHCNGLGFVNLKIIVYDCTCLLNDKTMCSECCKNNMGLHYVQPINKQGIVRIEYTPELLVDISPKHNVFQARLWTKEEIPVRQIQRKDSLSHIQSIDKIQPPSWEFEHGSISFDMNGFKNRDICLKGDLINEKGPLDTVWEYENSCTVCNEKKLPFCDYKIKGCQSLIKLQNYMYINTEHVKCELIEVN